jgi:ribosomal-protein-alanine N-acetyltransferase
MAEVPIRRLGIDDLGALFALECAAQPLGWSEDALLVELVHDDALVFGVVDDGALVAYVAVRQILDELWILNIATHPQHRRRGYAGRLLALAATWRPAPAGPAPSSLWLEVREGNVGARALYERHGFVVVGTRPGYYPGLDGRAREAAVVMRRPLP